VQIEATPRITNRARVGKDIGGNGEGSSRRAKEKTAMDLYMTLGPLLARLSSVQNSDSAMAATANYTNRQPLFRIADITHI
jgi:hypothetical protein